VRGLDLISYSPRIDIGDMHRTPYPNDSFDAIVVGWTLSYSSDPKAFAQEMIRIVRNGGLIAIGVEYSDMTAEDEVALLGYNIQERDKLADRINSTQAIFTRFDGRVEHVYFDHDAPAKRSHSRDGLIANVSRVAVIFSVKKG
jgi:SAM-dependent methyltransferase